MCSPAEGQIYLAFGVQGSPALITNLLLSPLEPLQNEVFASRHQDQNSVACIEEKCYVLTFAEYCR